jgi:type IV secretory pathway VirB3-like protein
MPTILRYPSDKSLTQHAAMLGFLLGALVLDFQLDSLVGIGRATWLLMHSYLMLLYILLNGLFILLLALLLHILVDVLVLDVVCFIRMWWRRAKRATKEEH